MTGLSLLALLASAGCNLGYGTPYPGAASRYRQFYTCSRIIGSTCYDAQLQEETGGGGAHGVLGGFSMGAEAANIGDTDTSGVAFDIRAEYSYSLSNWASVGAFAGVAFAAASIAPPMAPDLPSAAKMDKDLLIRRIPLGAKVTVTPTPPLILTAGAFVAPTSLRVDEQEAVSTTALGFSAGGGFNVPFPGLHLVLMFEWQHLKGGEVTVDSRTGNYGADVYLASYWLVF